MFRTLYLLAFTLLCGNVAFAFTLQGVDSNLKGWNKKEIVFRLNPTNCPSNVEGLLDEAISIWNSVPTSALRVRKGANIDISVAQIMTGASVDMPAIVCSTNILADAEVDPNAIPGLAKAFRVGADGHINYGFIILNAQEGTSAYIGNIDSERVKAIIAHEIGHVLGFGHSDITDALMYYDVTEKKDMTLAQDDMDAVTYLYPRDEFKDDQLLGGCAVIGMNSHLATFFVAILLFFPLLALRRRR